MSEKTNIPQSEREIWSQEGSDLYLTQSSVEYDKLSNGVYQLDLDGFGRFYLTKIHDEFVFDYKIYGLEESLIKRVVNTYTKTKSGNIGILLNGIKGTGKTVTSKVISNKLKLPVIVLGKKIKDCQLFINKIPQDIVVFLDEYEKVFGESSEMLTIMDGALNSEYRRVFILTTNKLYLDENLIQRPSRIRYLKTFTHLSPVIVEEIVDDILENKKFKNDCVKFISNLETITVDIVKAVLQEVNIHNESPETFKDVFNVKKLSGKFNIQIENENGEFEIFTKSAEINHKPDYKDHIVGEWFEINDTYIGEISQVINFNIIEISPFDKSVQKEYKKNMTKEPITIKVSDAEIKHFTYGYGDFGSFGAPRNVVKKKIDKGNVSALADVVKGKYSKDVTFADESES